MADMSLHYLAPHCISDFIFYNPPLTLSNLTTLDSLLFLEHSRLASASGPLLVLFSPRNDLPSDIPRAQSLTCIISLLVLFLARPTPPGWISWEADSELEIVCRKFIRVQATPCSPMKPFIGWNDIKQRSKEITINLYGKIWGHSQTPKVNALRLFW